MSLRMPIFSGRAACARTALGASASAAPPTRTCRRFGLFAALMRSSLACVSMWPFAKPVRDRVWAATPTETSPRPREVGCRRRPGSARQPNSPKQDQADPNKIAWICLVLFVRLGTYQRVAAKQIEKIPALLSSPRAPARRAKFDPAGWQEYSADSDFHKAFSLAFSFASRLQSAAPRPLRLWTFDNKRFS